MRVCMMAMAFTLGAIAMNEVEADQKDEPKEFKSGDTTYNERITLKPWEPRRAGGAGFLKTVENVWAVRVDSPKGLYFRVLGTTRPGADLEKHPGVFTTPVKKNSVIIDAAGNEYLVTESEGDIVAWVKLTKAAPKKP
jgi:hypothetical protein